VGKKGKQQKKEDKIPVKKGQKNKLTKTRVHKKRRGDEDRRNLSKRLGKKVRKCWKKEVDKLK